MILFIGNCTSRPFSKTILFLQILQLLQLMMLLLLIVLLLGQSIKSISSEQNSKVFIVKQQW